MTKEQIATIREALKEGKRAEYHANIRYAGFDADGLFVTALAILDTEPLPGAESGACLSIQQGDKLLVQPLRGEPSAKTVPMEMLREIADYTRREDHG